MSTYKTRRRILGADGEYHIIYEETSADQVLHSDGDTVEEHINSLYRDIGDVGSILDAINGEVV